MRRPLSFCARNLSNVFLTLLLAASLALVARVDAASGDAPSSAKAITWQVGFRPGVAYDLYSRLIAKYWVRYLRGHPAIIVENRVESATRTVERIQGEKPDGATIAMLIPALYLTQLADREKAKFDLAKLTWIGSPSKSHYLLYMRSDAPYKSMADIRSASTPPLCGAGEITTTGYYMPKLFEEAIGTKFNIKAGYREGPDVDTAVQKGELQCRSLTVDGFYSHEPYWTWMKTGFVRILLQTGIKRDARLPNVPTLPELMDEYKTSDANRRFAKLILASSDFGRPVVAPPGLPPAEAKMLGDTFNKVMKDPAFHAEAKREHLDINPTTGEDLDHLAKEVVVQPPEVVARMKKFLGM